MTNSYKPTVVVICGSSRFQQAMQEAAVREEQAGRIALWTTPGDYSGLLDPERQRLHEHLEWLHMRKIDLADEVLVLNIDHYVGESTSREIAYAYQQNKRLRYLQNPWPGHEGEWAARHWTRWHHHPLLRADAPPEFAGFAEVSGE